MKNSFEKDYRLVFLIIYAAWALKPMMPEKRESAGNFQGHFLRSDLLV